MVAKWKGAFTACKLHARLTTLKQTDGSSVFVIGLTDNLGLLLLQLVPHQQQDCPQEQHTAEVWSCGPHANQVLIYLSLLRNM
jgi:hypothetical protein